MSTGAPRTIDYIQDTSIPGFISTVIFSGVKMLIFFTSATFSIYNPEGVITELFPFVSH